MKIEKKEVNCIVLDVLAKGHPDDPRPPFKREPLVQAMGLEQFKLLELVPKPGIPIELYEKLYIGDGERQKIERVKRRIGYEELDADIPRRTAIPYRKNCQGAGA